MLLPLFLIIQTFFYSGASTPQPIHDFQSVLTRIYFEVKELGSYPGENFVKQEFFIGNDDDDDTNKDIHIVVLIQSMNVAEKMQIQVTYLERTREDAKVKYAKETKTIICGVAGNAVQVQRADYGERDLEELAGDILKAVQNKKRLLKNNSMMDTTPISHICTQESRVHRNPALNLLFRRSPVNMLNRR